MARKLIDVISKIRTVPTPEGQDSYIFLNLMRQLTSIQSSLDFAPPENEQFWWTETQHALSSCCQPPLTEDWQIKIIAIFMDQTEEEIKTQFGVKK